ncbi:MAG: efflux RND transporter periplasmic adaptor subunit [Erysipelotrichaceae bacterium]
MKKTVRFWSVLGIFVIFLIALLWVVNQGFNSIQTTDAIATTIRKETLQLTSSASGKVISANTEVQTIPGTLSSIEVSLGDAVSKGDTLATYTNVLNQSQTLSASMDGLVTQIPDQSGNVFVLSDPNQLEIRVQISERDILRVAKGQTTQIYIEALDQSFAGKVKEVSQIGSTQAEYTLYPVVIAFEEVNDSIYLGMSGSARIEVATLENVLVVRRDALVEQDGKRYLVDRTWLDHQRQPKSDYFIEVTTGGATLQDVEIMSGVEVGQEVLVFPDTSFDLFSGPPTGSTGSNP